MVGDDKRNAQAGPSKPRKRKAGGEGKKGKVFLENKQDLLSLVSDVTGSKESLVKNRVDKSKAALAEHPIKMDDGARKKRAKAIEGQGQVKKSAKRERELKETKEKILQRQKEKKARLKQRSKGDPPVAQGDGGAVKKKKSVGFA